MAVLLQGASHGGGEEIAHRLADIFQEWSGGKAEFACEPSSQWGEATRFLLDEELGKVGAEVSRYTASWQIDVMECGEDPFMGPSDPPIYDGEEHPFSIPSLYHRADKWKWKLLWRQVIGDDMPEASDLSPSEPGATQEAQAEPENLFRLRGEFWEVRYRGVKWPTSNIGSAWVR